MFLSIAPQEHCIFWFSQHFVDTQRSLQDSAMSEGQMMPHPHQTRWCLWSFRALGANIYTLETRAPVDIHDQASLRAQRMQLIRYCPGSMNMMLHMQEAIKNPRHSQCDAGSGACLRTLVLWIAIAVKAPEGIWWSKIHRSHSNVHVNQLRHLRIFISVHIAAASLVAVL